MYNLWQACSTILLLQHCPYHDQQRNDHRRSSFDQMNEQKLPRLRPTDMQIKIGKVPQQRNETREKDRKYDLSVRLVSPN